MAQHPGDYVVDQPGRGIFSVDRAVFHDEDVCRGELERVFEGTWVYLAHDSQLPDACDAFATNLGRQPVVVTRNAQGKLSCFINACAHRGAQLCRTQISNQRVLTCPYHGWSYDCEGRNIGIKDRAGGGYHPTFETRDHGLTPIPRLGSYRGFIFGSLNAEVPELSEHLGDARLFIDMMVDSAPLGLEVVRGSSTFSYNGNWKLILENSLDGYHFSSVHPTYIRIVAQRAQRAAGKVGTLDAGGTASAMVAGGYDLGRGHAVIWSVIPNPEVLPLHERRTELVAQFGETRADWMIARLRNLVVYPNLMLLYQIAGQIRVVRPLSAGVSEVTTYCIAPVGESAVARMKRVMQYADFFGASGIGTPDDLAVFEACQKGYAGTHAREQGYDRGLTRMAPGADSYARALGIEPVGSSASFGDETLFHGQYREWVRLMTRGGRDGQ